jgi:nicotinamidase-related amidase
MLAGDPDVRARDALPPWKCVVTDADLEVYRRAGYQQRYGVGKRPALLIIDVEYNFTGDCPEPILDSIAKYPDSCGPAAWQAMPQIRTLLEQSRQVDLPIVFTQSNQEPGTVRSPRLGTQIVDELAPAGGELVLTKAAASAFFGTSLISHLVGWGIDTLIHAGCVTSGCIRATVVDAAAYGFKNVIVEECVFDRAEAPHLMSLFDMDAKYGDVMTLAEVRRYLTSLRRPRQTP